MASMVAFAQALSAYLQRAKGQFIAAGLKTRPSGAGAGSSYHGPPPSHYQEIAVGFGCLVEGLKTMETQLGAMGDLINNDLWTGGLLTTAGNDFRAANTAASGTGFFVNWSGPPTSYYTSMARGFQHLAGALQVMDRQITAIRPELERAVKAARTVPGYDPTFWQRNTAVLNNNTFSVPTSILAPKGRP